jgi:N-methylhydantoinase B
VKARHWKVNENGDEQELPNVVITTIKKGEIVRGNTTSGGGYGDPRERDPERVLKDVLDGFETIERASELYGLVFMRSPLNDDLAVDVAATVARRCAHTRS